MQEYEKSQLFQFDQYGNLNSFCMRLDYEEQLCYYELQKVSKLDPWLFYCDDINMLISGGTLYPCSAFLRDKFIDEIYYDIYQDFYEKTSFFIKKWGSFILSTDFAEIPEFTGNSKDFYLPNKKHTYLIGENEDYYFIVDRIEYVETYKDITISNDKSVLQIPKMHFKKAFGKFYRVSTYAFKNLPDSNEDKLIFLWSVLSKITENYFKDNMGRCALNQFYQSIQNKNYNILNNYFGIHMLLSRRVILKKCLYNYRDCIQNSEKLINLLDQAILYWRKMKDISKDYVNHKRIPSEDAYNIIQEMADNERSIVGSILDINQTYYL